MSAAAAKGVTSGSTQVPLVMHVIHRLAVGGLENGLVNLINHLPRERFRHAVVCVTDATDFAARIERCDVSIVELHKLPGNSIAIQQRFFDAFRSMRPDVVHTRNLGTIEAQVAAALARVPVRIHGEHGWDVTDPDGSNRRYAAIRRLVKPFVHRYVALSAHIETYLRERVRIPAARIDRICNGVDCERFRPSAAIRATFPEPAFRDPALVVVGTVGRMEAIKDPLTLAHAFVEALRRRPDARRFLRLAIIGGGSLAHAVEQVLAEGGVSELAWLPGERSDIASLLPALDIFVLPSKAEGISNTLLEAMACGLSAVTTRVGGNVELVRHDETGLLVAPGNPAALADAIERLAGDAGLRARMGAAARARAVAEFSLSEMVRRYAALYRRELERRVPFATAGDARPHASVEQGVDRP